jgi:hypothetical protein
MNTSYKLIVAKRQRLESERMARELGSILSFRVRADMSALILGAEITFLLWLVGGFN